MVHDLGGRCFFSHLMSLERAGCGYCANLNSSGKLSELDADAGCARRRLPSPVLLCSCGRILLSHVLRMGWPILFFHATGFCLGRFLGDLAAYGAGICPSRVGKVPKEAAWT